MLTRKNPKVNQFFKRISKWHDELETLRKIILSCGLTEELKWGQPCYTVDNDRNVIIIGGFKDYCAIMFVKGVLLHDSKNILIQQTFL